MSHYERNEAIAEIRKALKRRSGKTWSVKGGQGTSWGWINVSAPPKRCDKWGSMQPDDAEELATLMGLDHAHHQGVSIPSGGNYREEYVARAKGEEPTVYGQRYWD